MRKLVLHGLKSWLDLGRLSRVTVAQSISCIAYTYIEHWQTVQKIVAYMFLSYKPLMRHACVSVSSSVVFTDCTYSTNLWYVYTLTQISLLSFRFVIFPVCHQAQRFFNPSHLEPVSNQTDLLTNFTDALP